MQSRTPEELALETKILARLADPDYRPVKPRTLAKKLLVTPEQMKLFRRLVKRLVIDGRATWGDQHYLQPTALPAVPSEPVGNISSETDVANPKRQSFSWKELDWEADDPNALAFEAIEAVIGDEAAIPFCKAELRRSRPKRETSETLWKHESARKRANDPIESEEGPITGIFQRHEAGFGFVRPMCMGDSSERVEDIHVPAKYAMDAATGDRVQVRLRKSHKIHRRGFRDRDRGPTGEIVEILERGQQNFVGTFFSREGNGWVQLDGTAFPNPIFIGDCSNHAVQPHDKVVVEIVRYPTRNNAGEATITEVLGSARDAGVDTQMVMREFNLPDHFDDIVLAEARMEAREFEAESSEAPTTGRSERLSFEAGRRDLTAETVITIDPVDARDFDDAISLQRLGCGWRLGVHIADVSRFVRAGTALDREAYQRGTSVYLPDRVIPMLPEIISNGLASLQPGKPRYTKSVFIDFSPEGTRLNVALANTIICNKHRFGYEEVDEFLEQETEPTVTRRSALGADVYHLLLRMRELSRILRERRQQRGAIELDFSDVRVDLDRDGRVTGGHTIPRTESRRMVEDFMLAANEAVAETLSEAGLAFLRRIHPAPSTHKTEQLGEFLIGLGYQGESLENRWSLQRLLDHSRGKPEESAIQYAVLRSLQKAVYSPKEEAHFALAAKHYTHFTSPIRRYPDLTIHRIVDEYIRSTGDMEAKAAGNGTAGTVGNTASETAVSPMAIADSSMTMGRWTNVPDERSDTDETVYTAAREKSHPREKLGKHGKQGKKSKESAKKQQRSNLKESKQFRNLWLLGEHCTQREQLAEEAERTLVKLKLLGWLRDRVGSIFEGVITGTARYGFFVQPLEIPIEGLVPVESLPGPHDYDESAHTLSSRRRHHVYRPGDPVHVAVKRVNLLKRQLDFELVQHRSRTEKLE